MSIETLQPGLMSALALVGLMGFRHGFDADHIALVDGMTRARQLHRSYWTSRLVGLQFALGHSATVMVAALLLYGQSAKLPQWFDGLGMAISACFLLVVAASNLGHSLSPPDTVPRPLGPVSAALFRLTGHHLHPALVGMAFAISLDSLGQAAFFATRGNEYGAVQGLGAVALLSLSFGVGMTLADASNGALLSWFAGRSDRLAHQASRLSSAFIAVIAVLTVGAGVLRATQQGFSQEWERSGIWIGVGMLALTSTVYALHIVWRRGRSAGATLGRV